MASHRPALPPLPPHVGPVLALLLVVSMLAGPGPASAQTPVSDLRDLLAPGFLVDDTNGDGHIDRIHARIRIAPEAGEAGVAAAGNLAARLGFESYASDLALLHPPGAPTGDRPLVVVGTDEAFLAALGVEVGEALRGLAPGEGIVLRLPAGEALPGGGVWVAGADATGLLVAAAYLAGRYPSVWQPEGPTLDAWADELGQSLAADPDDAAADPDEDADPDDDTAAPDPPVIRLERIVVGQGRDGILRLGATVVAPTEEAAGALSDRIRAADDALLPPGLQRLDLTVAGPDGPGATERILPEREWSAPSAQPWQPRDVGDFTLSALYTNQGIYRDTRQDLVPDRTEAILSVAGTESAAGALALANRIGLETAGIRLPFARVAGEDDRPERDGFPILFGLDHYRAARLVEEERLGVPTGAAGEGFVEFVAGASGERSALVVSGSDAQGLDAAAALVAGRLPYLNRYEKGQFELEELETEVRRFFQTRTVGGTTALALAKLEQWITRLEEGDRPHPPTSDAPWPPETGSPTELPESLHTLDRIEIELALDTVPEGLESYLNAHLEDRLGTHFADTEVTVALRPSGFGAGEPVFDERFEMPWEVDDVRARLEAELYPRVEAAASGGDETAGEPGGGPPSVQVEIRVSEPPEIRRALHDEVRAELEARGADPAQLEVRIVNAYKQGFSWIEDHLLPELREQDVHRIEIDYHHLRDTDELPWQVVGSDTRWIQELFPIDAVLARELGIDEDDVVFRPTGEADPVYRFRAFDAGGGLLMEEAFDPRYDIRPYFGLHDDYEQVRVSTGWVEAIVGDAGQALQHPAR